MATVLLLRPPSVFARASYSAPVTMPLAIAYLAANLIERGHEALVIDALGEGLDHVGTSYSPKVLYRGLCNRRIIERIASLPRPQLIGVTAMFSQDWPHIEDLLGEVHRAWPDVPIVVGGEHATAATEHVLRSCPAVRFVARGEGEETIVDLAEHADGRRRIDEVPGVAWLDRGALRLNPARQRVREPDQLPWPAWHLFDLEPYFATGEGHGVERGRSMPILATRGCPYRCTFCSSPSMWTTRYVMRSVTRVVDEIERYVRVYRAENIDFFDLTAVIKRQWILDFCAELQARGLRITWQLPSGTRSEAMDAAVLRAMAAAGCRNVTYAPESGSERTLRDVRKKVSLPRLVESIRAAKANDVFVKCNLIIGFPQEERADVLQTLGLVIRLAWIGADDAGVFPFSPYPGTELYDYLRGVGVIGAMDRAYFESLTTFMDLETSSRYCKNLGPRELAFYRLAGMGAFYGLSYALRPRRVLRSVRNYRAGRSDTAFEERLFALLRRHRPAPDSLLQGAEHA